MNAISPLPGFHQGTACIEQGYFIFTLMPSLFCKLRCPHCYLSLEQRQDRSIMPVEALAAACRKVDEFELAMNRAAEKAVPVAADVFADAVRQMTVRDAIDIVRGEPDGPVKFHYPAPTLAEDFGVAA